MDILNMMKNYIVAYSFIAIFVLVCSLFKLSIGFESIYIQTLMKLFQFGRFKIEKEGSHSLLRNNAYSSSNALYNLEYFHPKNNFFHFSDICEPIKCTITTIIDDEVTKRFTEEELSTWNLLSRTNNGYCFVSWRLTLTWFAGFMVRYFILFPWRITFFLLTLFFSGILLIMAPILPKLKCVENLILSCMYHSASIALSIFAKYHNREFIPTNQCICVANHTTPIDSIILNCDRLYNSVGQTQDGLFGFFQKVMAMYGNVFFERSHTKDRKSVVDTLKILTTDPSSKPILIFPEGTCINNTSVMKFSKGSFEIGCKIFPVAIKYDRHFSNAFWNSSRESFGEYLFSLMTSWAVVVDLWYLPPMVIGKNENSIEFANRVKHCIAEVAGLVDLDWDGQLKRTSVPEALKSKKQKEFAEIIKLLHF